jgi:Zn-dependent peptidase ImmA (M78 family)
LAIHFSKWIDTRFELPATDLPDLGLERNPEAAAEYIRSHWQIGQLPVRNLVHLLESKGVRVFSLSVASTEIDAISTWKGDTPYVFLNTYKSSERSRFDAAHELGHLVMHKHGGPQGRKAELEANAFASAFLMPRGSVLANAPKFVTLPELVRLKKVWGVSLAALNYRLHQLKLVSDWQYRALSIEIAKRGYRVNEPNEGERETSLVLPLVFSNLYENDGLTRGRVAQELDLFLPVLETIMFSLIMTGVEGGRRSTRGGTERAKDSARLSRVK